MKRFLIAVLLTLTSASVCFAQIEWKLVKKNEREEKIKSALNYLDEAVKEIQWIEIEGNTVYIGFKALPEDYVLIIKGAALRGNKAIDFGVHVWAISAEHRGWRPGKGPYYGEATARYGKIQR